MKLARERRNQIFSFTKIFGLKVMILLGFSVMTVLHGGIEMNH